MLFIYMNYMFFTFKLLLSLALINMIFIDWHTKVLCVFNLFYLPLMFVYVVNALILKILNTKGI